MRRSWLAEQGVAPGSLCPRNQSPGRLGSPPAPSQDGGCLKWLDVDGLKGGARCRLDRGEVMLVGPSPEERPERRNATSGAPEGARAGHKARGRLRKVPSTTKRRPALRSLMGARKEEEGGAPRLKTQGADEARLYIVDDAEPGKRVNRTCGGRSVWDNAPDKNFSLPEIVKQQHQAASLRAFIRRGESDPQ